MLLHCHVPRALCIGWFLCIAFVPHLVAHGAPRRPPPDIDERAFRSLRPAVVEALLAEGPSITDLHRHVLAAAGIDRTEPERWRRSVRRAPLLPRLQFGMRHSLQDNIDLSVKDSVSVTSGGVVIGPRTNDLQERTDRNTYFDVRAVWALQELVFAPESLRVSHEARARRQEVRDLLHWATQLYAEYQRLRILRRAQDERLRARDYGVAGSSHIVARLRLEEVTHELDGLTNGWFSQAAAAAVKTMGQKP